MRTDIDVLVIGGGQAGLAVSHGLTQAGIEHVVLEQGRVAQSWDGRWDSFRLVTPNRTIALPGGGYRGDDPDGYLTRAEIADHLRTYATSFGAPVIEETGVEALRRGSDGFIAETSDGGIRARDVVVCTGAYQREHRPPFLAQLERAVPVVGTTEYRSPGLLPDGRVLVVGGGQSGCQIAEELSRAGRDVVVAASRAPAIPRRVAGRDTVAWLVDVGFFGHTLSDMPSSAVRLASNPLAIGSDDGHDLNLQTLSAMGVQLIGHVRGSDGTRIVADDDLAESVQVGADAFRQVCAAIARLAAERGEPVPDLPAAPTAVPGAAEPPLLADLGVVINATGYRPAYEWIDLPDIVDDMGFPRQHDGSSLSTPGLWFVGVPWMRTRGSPLLLGVGDDANLVADRLAAR